MDHPRRKKVEHLAAAELSSYFAVEFLWLCSEFDSFDRWQPVYYLNDLLETFFAENCCLNLSVPWEEVQKYFYYYEY